MTDNQDGTQQDPLEEVKQTVAETIDDAQAAAGQAAAAAQEKAHDLGEDIQAGLERAQTAIERSMAGVGDTQLLGSLDAPSEDDRLWSILAHLSGFVLPIIGPLLIMLLRKPQTAFVKDQAREALNYQITGTLISLAFVVFTMVTLGVGGCLAPALFLLAVPPVLAALKNGNHEAYRYPFTLRLVK